MKAVKEGNLPNLRRIELEYCKMNNCEWPAVPEFSCILKTAKMSDLSQIHKQLLKLTELTVPSAFPELPYVHRLIHVRLENLSVLNLEFIEDCEFQCLNDVLKQGFLPNLSELFVERRHSVIFQLNIDQFLHEFDPNHISKLEKLTLRYFTISAKELEILSEKLTSVGLTELDLTHSSGFTGNLSALFTHSFPRLNTLILIDCDLNSEDLQSLARANVEGKLPQLRHLDIAGNDDVEVSYLFTHSAQWNQLKTLRIYDPNILNIETEFLNSLEELHVSLEEDQKPLQDVTRCWPGLKTIQLRSNEDILYIADGVERGMFPDLKIVRGCYEFEYEVSALSLFKLFKANIVVMLVVHS